MKNWGLFYPLLYIYLLCDEVLRPWNFGNPRFDVRDPQDPPPTYEKKPLKILIMWQETMVILDINIACVWGTFILEIYCKIPLGTRQNHYVLNNQL